MSWFAQHVFSKRLAESFQGLATYSVVETVVLTELLLGSPDMGTQFGLGCHDPKPPWVVHSRHKRDCSKS